jgi:gamma-glutamyl-gamma-aminobutyrate hydrolase PuuD
MILSLVIFAVVLVEINSLKRFTNKINANGPVIGVLATPNPSNPPAKSEDEKNGTESFAVIDLNYIFWLQSAGARVVPVLPWWTPEQLSQKLQNINGVVFQGGSMKYKTNRDYLKTGLAVLDHAQKNPKNFVVWGICNGFQLINHWAFDRTNKDNCNYKNKEAMEGFLLPATENKKYQSRMLAGLSAEERKNLLSNPTTAHYHGFSVDMRVMQSAKYNKKLHVVAFANSPHDKKDKKNPTGLDDGNKGKFFDQGTNISKAFAAFLVKEATPSKSVSAAQFQKLNPLPNIKAIIDEQINLIINKPKTKGYQIPQKNTDGVAILSCGRFSYSWYSKTQENSTKVQFVCTKQVGSA